jgi:phage-related minor tail protein
MASSRIKGITVEIGGNTVGLQNALRDVNNRTKEVQSELKDVERLLKFDPNNVELLAQRQELLTQAIQSSTTKLNELKQAEAQVQAQFERGEISQEQYRGFRRELQQTEQQLQGFQQSLQDMQTEQEQVGQRTRQMSALFDATGTSVEDYSNVIGTRLVRAIQNGTATSRDLEYAFQRVGRQAIGAGGDIERLRQSLMTVDSGNSIQNIRRDLQQLQQEAEQTAESVDGIGESLQGVAGALVAGGGIAGSIEQALDAASLNTKIDITFDVPESSMQSVKEAVKGIEAYGLDGEEALEGVRRQWALNKDASDAANLSISKGAAAIAKNFAGVDFIELIQETNEIASGLKISNQNALALVDSLLKAGFPPEQLDTIAEYGTQMQLAGFSMKEIQSIFEAGISTKTWNIDNLNDGVKEARLTMASFGLEIPAALAPLIDQAGMSQKQFQSWGKAVAAGGKEGSKAMSEVAKWLETIDNKELKNELATKVFGTKWEDQGDNMIAVFNGVATAADKTTENINGLYETVGKTNADPMVELQHAINNVKMAAAPTLLVIADLISKIANWVAENPKLAATLATIATATGVIIGAIMGLIPIVLTVVTTMKTFGITIGAILSPIGWIIAAIAGLVTVGVLLYKNWDTFGKTASSVFNSVKSTITSALGAIQESLTIVGNAIGNFAGPLIEKVGTAFQNLGSTIMEILIGDLAQLGEFFKMLLPSLTALMVGGLPGLIISASRFLPAIAEGMDSNKGVLIETINGVVASIIEFLEVGLPQLVGTGLTIVLSLIEGIVGALPAVIAAGVSLIESIIQGIGTALPIIVTLAIEVVTSLITAIAGALPQVISAGVGILNALISGIISILPLLIGAAVLLITSIVQTLVQNLPKIISAGVEILTALIAGVLKILPSLVTAAVNLIVTIVSTLAQNLPKIIKAGVDVLQALISGIIQILPVLIQTAINLVIQIAKAIIQNLPTILKAGKDILLALIDGIISIVATLLSTVAKEIVSPLIKQFKGIDLLQVGKDIIRGLVNGIGAMAGSIKAKVEELASNIPDWAKEVLGIHSPSRVMRDQVGVYVGEGLAKGIDNSKSTVEKSSKDLADAAWKPVTNALTKQISDIFKQADKAAAGVKKSSEKIKKSFNEAMAVATSKYKVGKLDTTGYIASLEAIKTEYGKTAEQVRKVDSEITKHRKVQVKERAEAAKKDFEASKKYIDEKKFYNEMSLADELKAWEKIQSRYKAGTEERKEADRQVYSLKKQMNDQMVSINEDYLSKVKTLNQQLIDEEKKLNEEYQRALSEREKSLVSFAGLFDEVTAKQITGDTLLHNLETQVQSFEQWQKNMAELAARGINEGLLAELQEMGPKAGSEIAALNMLTDEQLNQYVSLWTEKNRLAKEQSMEELEGLRIQTQEKVEALRMKTAEQLLGYQNEWKKSMTAVRGTVRNEMAGMPDIGSYAVSGLIRGLLSRKNDLISVTQQLANVVTGTFQAALDIHSPSRVFKGFGININEGLIEGIKSSSKMLDESLQSVYGNLSNSAGQMLQAQGEATSSRTVDNSKKMYNTINISTNTDSTRSTEKMLRRLAFEF